MGKWIKTDIHPFMSDPSCLGLKKTKKDADLFYFFSRPGQTGGNHLFISFDP